MNLRYKFPFYLCYFKSTLAISIPLAIVYGFLYVLATTDKNLDLNIVISILKCWCTIGLFFAIGYKHYTHSNEYYFYHNAGISKINLFVAIFLIYVSISILIYFICAAANNLI